jgi:uncharacterized membrane protein SirB2
MKASRYIRFAAALPHVVSLMYVGIPYVIVYQEIARGHEQWWIAVMILIISPVLEGYFFLWKKIIKPKYFDDLDS